MNFPKFPHSAMFDGATNVGETEYLQFGTQVKCRWSRDRNDRTAENAFSAPCFFSEMELEPAAG